MIEFFILIVGGIVGVILDRAWGSIEKVVKLKLEWAYFMDICRDEGIKLTVSNAGVSEIPECEVSIYHPDRGTLLVFQKETNGNLLPGQEDVYKCPLLQYGEPNQFLKNWFARTTAVTRKPEAENEARYSFRLLMDKGYKVIWESEDIGDVLAQEIQNFFATGNAESVSLHRLMATSLPKRSHMLSRIAAPIQKGWHRYVCRFFKAV